MRERRVARATALVVFFTTLVFALPATAIEYLIPLPFEYGSEWYCVQGNFGGYSHMGKLKYSYDFNKNSDLNGVQSVAFGKDVLSPINGEIIDKVDHIPDFNYNDESCPENNSGWGNTLLIKDHKTGRYLRFAHFQKWSTPGYLQVGSEVVMGEVIGRVGNSGWSSGPHLHVHMQETKEGGAKSVKFNFIEGPISTGKWATSELWPMAFVIDRYQDESLSNGLSFWFLIKSYGDWTEKYDADTNEVTGKSYFEAKTTSTKKPYAKWMVYPSVSGFYMILARYPGGGGYDPKAEYSVSKNKFMLPWEGKTTHKNQNLSTGNHWHQIALMPLKKGTTYYIIVRGTTPNTKVAADSIMFARIDWFGWW